jgi:hypothetical protein
MSDEPKIVADLRRLAATRIFTSGTFSEARAVMKVAADLLQQSYEGRIEAAPDEDLSINPTAVERSK